MTPNHWVACHAQKTQPTTRKQVNAIWSVRKGSSSTTTWPNVNLFVICQFSTITHPLNNVWIGAKSPRFIAPRKMSASLRRTTITAWWRSFTTQQLKNAKRNANKTNNITQAPKFVRSPLAQKIWGLITRTTNVFVRGNIQWILKPGSVNSIVANSTWSSTIPPANANVPLDMRSIMIRKNASRWSATIPHPNST